MVEHGRIAAQLDHLNSLSPSMAAQPDHTKLVRAPECKRKELHIALDHSQSLTHAHG